MSSPALFLFDDAPRRFRTATPSGFEALAEDVAASAGASDAPAWVDFDPRWRTLVVLSADGAGPGTPYFTELLVGEGLGEATRKGLVVRVVAAPADRGAGLGMPAGAPVPVTHGLRRACRRGPAKGYPVTDAQFGVHVEGRAPSVGDLHAAAHQAAARALAAAATAPRRTDDGGNGEVPPFPDLETSAGDVVLNLRDLCHWPIARMEEPDRVQVGAFLAYQASLLYGHTVDERMARVPAAPPEPLRPFLAAVTDDLLAHAAAATTDPDAGPMVAGLIETWVTGWK